MVDMVTPRNELNATFGRLIDMIRRPKPGASIVPIKAGNKADNAQDTSSEKAD